MAKQVLQRTDLLDTELDFHRKFIKRLRKLQPGERVRMTFELIRSVQHSGKPPVARELGCELHRRCGGLQQDSDGGRRPALAWRIVCVLGLEPRATNGADFLLELDADKIEAVIAASPADYQIEERYARELASSPSQFEAFQTLHLPLMFKLDCFVAASDWDQEQLERAIPVEVAPGYVVPFADPETTIIAKCRWFDLGNRVSDRQWNDLVRLYEVQRNNLDAGYIEGWLRRFDLLDLWDEIRKQAQV